MAAQVAAVMADAGCGPVSVVGRQAGLQQLGLPVVPDPRGVDHHPLWGVVAALRHAAGLGARSALLAPCDLPDLDVDTVMRLAGTSAPAVGETSERLQPLFAHMPVSWLDRVHAFAKDGRSVRRLWTTAPVPIARIPVHADIVRDLDSPEDVAEWTQRRTRGR